MLIIYVEFGEKKTKLCLHILKYAKFFLSLTRPNLFLISKQIFVEIIKGLFINYAMRNFGRF
jgi:predicted ATP-dependent endonuclease of OLD family